MGIDQVNSSEGRPRSITIRLRCSDEREFRRRYAPWYAAEGIFVPGTLPVPLGASLGVAIELKNGHRVFSGIARVEAEIKEPLGAQLRFLRVDSGSMPLAPTLTPVEQALESSADPSAPHSGDNLAEALFADLPPPERTEVSKPLEVRTSEVKLRLRPTPVPGKY